MDTDPFVPLPERAPLTPEEAMHRARDFRRRLEARRSVRDFARRPLPPGVLEDCLLAAGSAPSGAHRQPWRFVVVQNANLKRRIREAAEAEEKAFYERRAPQAWLDALARLGTTAEKPFLETAPALIAIFSKRWSVDADGGRVKNYYVDESVGIATGFLIAALHDAGLATLTHTPSPMAFLGRILERPENERAFLLLVVGYPAEGARVPVLTRKPLDEIALFMD